MRGVSRKALKAILFKVFLHVNHNVLNDFQKEVLKLVLDDGADCNSIAEAISKIDKHILLLSRAGWAPDKKQGDQVLKPDHYERFPMEPTYFIVESGGYHWNVENFIKYITRFPFKNGLEDLGKAMRNLAMYIRHQDGDRSWSR
jgi:hypothetical protein